jgi:uncharacterized lipoprotein YddW (UPF0748 family)
MRKFINKTAIVGMSVIFTLLLALLLVEWTADLEPEKSYMLDYSSETEETKDLSGDTAVPAAAAPDSGDFRAMWVATILNLDYPSKTSLSTDELKAEADKILDECCAMGMTAVILQVRPCGDALYSSSIFPWSDCLTGTQGAVPANGFDPLKYWIEGAHKRGLELHAWVNPFRVTRKSTDLTALAANNPARLHPEWVVEYDGSLYYNPGIPEVRKLVIDGVKEIVSNYEVTASTSTIIFIPVRNLPITPPMPSIEEAIIISAIGVGTTLIN